MKSIFSSVLVLILVFASFITAYSAVKIDSEVHGYEWDDAEYIVLITGADVNNVDYSLVKCCYDSNGYDAYYMLYLTDSKSDSLDECGFIFSLNNDIEVTITQINVISDYDSSLYNVETAMKIVENDGVYCEIKVAFKKGLPDTVSGTVSYIDGEGNNSYYYPFAFAYKEVELTKKSTIAKTEKTTKPKTTEAKAVKTTSKPKTTSKVTTTKQAATEKIKTTSAKKSESKTVVYFYEKEVLISQVYVTDTPTQTSVINAEEITTAVASTELAQDNLEMADKIAVQKIICAVGGVVLIAFAAWAGLSAKKKHSENDNSAQKDDELNNDEK